MKSRLLVKAPQYSSLDSLDDDGDGSAHRVADRRVRLRKLQQIIQVRVARVLRFDVHLDADALGTPPERRLEGE